MKIGLLTGSSFNEFQKKILEPILHDDSFSIEVAIIDKRPLGSILQKIKKNILHGRGGYIFIMAIKEVLSKTEEAFDVKEYCFHNGIAMIDTADPYSSETIQQIGEFDLDLLILIGGFGVVKSPLLDLAPILSYHHGDMRKYRGMPPGFWELYNHETEMGVTVQLLGRGLDCGIPIEEKTIEILKADTVRSLQNRAIESSTDMMYKALKKYSDANFEPERIVKYGVIYTLPNLRQWTKVQFHILKSLCFE